MQEMRQREFEPSVLSYIAAICAYEKGGQREQTLELLQEMQLRGFGQWTC